MKLAVFDSPASPSDPSNPAATLRARGGALPSRRRHWLARIGAALLAACVLAPGAWDADAMLQAARLQGPYALAGARSLHSLLAGLLEQDESAKLDAVNEFFNNRIVFASDTEVWGQSDYWASPIELLAKGRGDCEDYVIAKYFALLAAGVPAPKLRLVYVRARVGAADTAAVAHMVLAYHAWPAAAPLILDNLVREVRPSAQRPDLDPVFSFNGDGLWQGANPASSGDPVARLSRWREVLAKARTSGFQ